MTKHPNSNLQHPEKLQDPNPNVLASLDLGIWKSSGCRRGPDAVYRGWMLDVGIFLLQIVCSVSVSAVGAPALTDVFTAGSDGYSCYRIPAVITTLKGTVLAVADGRIKTCADIPNPLDLVLKRSFDGGKTWTPLQLVADYGSNTNDIDTYPAYGLTNPVPRVAAGDAALLLDRTNGRVWVIYDNGAFVPTQAHHRALKLELRYSDDDGQTWSPAVDVEAQNAGLRPDGTDFMASPGNGIQLTEGPHAGRLIFAAYVWAKPFYSTLIYSDDHGQTWRRGGNAGTGGGEIQVAETSKGHLLATIRNNAFPQKGVRFFNQSDDGGETWATPYCETKTQPALSDPKCQAGLLRVKNARGFKKGVWALSNAADPSSRTNLTLRISRNGGRTWSTSRLIYNGGSAYSALTMLPSGELGILFEADKYKRICFTTVQLP
jgi:sialidase-1